MIDLTLDFETYFDSRCSLKKLPTIRYVRDDAFKIHGCAVKVNDEAAQFIFGHQLADFFAQFDWPETRVISHNANFDLLVLHDHFAIHPGDRVDTLGLCRALLPRDIDFDLDNVAPLLGLTGKKGGGKALQDVKGVTDPSLEQLAELAEYAKHDAYLCYRIYCMLYPMLPPNERRIMNLVLRFSTQGVFIDSPETRQALQDARQEILDDRQAKLDAVPYSAEALRSRDRFAEILKEHGVEPPTKLSPRTGQLTWAFSKQDPEFVALRADTRVAALADARMAVSSHNAISRIDSLEEIFQRPPHTLPVQLNYNGAHCVPGDTEVLTPSGWVRIDEWEGGNIVQARPDHTLYWAPATRFDGPSTIDWVRCSARYLQCDFTPGHRVPYIKHDSTEWGETSAQEAADRNSIRVPVAGTLQSAGTLSAPQMRVIAMVQADGSYETNIAYGRKLSIFLKRPRKIARARQLLTDAGVPYREQSYASWPDYVRFIIRWHELPEWLSPHCKEFGAWLLDSTPDGRVAFIEELRHWDGWTQPNGYYNHASVYYCTTIKSNAEWVQTISHLVGYSASLCVKNSGSNRKPLYVVCFSRRSPCRRLVKKRDWSIPTTSPKRAYCAQTETGFWLARANGHIFITGNTGRFSGGGKINMQNLNARGVGSSLRKGIRVAEDYVLIVVDQSAIELRLNMWFSGQHDVLHTLASGGDVYVAEAARQFNKPETEIGKLERTYGKVIILGAGYGLGPPRFRVFVATGPYGMPPRYLTDGEASQTIMNYRSAHPKVVHSWHWLNDVAIPQLYTRGSGMDGRAVRYEHEAIRLPSGLALTYPNLQPTENGWQWGYTYGRNLWGGTVQENIVQALTGVLIKEEMDELDRTLHGDEFTRQYQMGHRGLKPYRSVHDALASKAAVCHQVHDEVLLVCRERDADDICKTTKEIMTRPPSWAPDLPLEVEITYHPFYTKP